MTIEEILDNSIIEQDPVTGLPTAESIIQAVSLLIGECKCTECGTMYEGDKCPSCGCKTSESTQDEHIVKVSGGYQLRSKKTGKNLGTYPTLAGAKKRERQVQFFKHRGESVVDEDQYEVHKNLLNHHDTLLQHGWHRTIGHANFPYSIYEHPKHGHITTYNDGSWSHQPPKSTGVIKGKTYYHLVSYLRNVGESIFHESPDPINSGDGVRHAPITGQKNDQPNLDVSQQPIWAENFYTLASKLGEIIPEVHLIVTACDVLEERSVLAELMNEISFIHQDLQDCTTAATQHPDHPDWVGVYEHFNSVLNSIIDAMDPYATPGRIVAPPPYMKIGAELHDNRLSESFTGDPQVDQTLGELFGLDDNGNRVDEMGLGLGSDNDKLLMAHGWKYQGGNSYTHPNFSGHSISTDSQGNWTHTTPETSKSQPPIGRGSSDKLPSHLQTFHKNYGESSVGTSKIKIKKKDHPDNQHESRRPPFRAQDHPMHQLALDHRFTLGHTHESANNLTRTYNHPNGHRLQLITSNRGSYHSYRIFHREGRSTSGDQIHELRGHLLRVTDLDRHQSNQRSRLTHESAHDNVLSIDDAMSSITRTYKIRPHEVRVLPPIGGSIQVTRIFVPPQYLSEVAQVLSDVYDFHSSVVGSMIEVA